eukprot:11698951-Prorocentrum_lima.AAC.1
MSRVSDPVSGRTVDGFPLLLITWGTLGRAFYEAVRRYPDNPNVKASLEAGLRYICIVDGRVPKDVL